jgi:dihydrofolate reductase
MTSAHVFIASSLDGFIAKPDGDIEWLLSRDDPSEDHGFNEFIKDIDLIVMGRGTFEKVMDLDPWPYPKPTIVLSKSLNSAALPARLKDKVQFLDLTPQALMQKISKEENARIYVDGGQTIQSFLRSGLIDDLVITQVPVLLGKGRTLFGDLEDDIPLALVASRSFASGLVQSKYRVIKGRR